MLVLPPILCPRLVLKSSARFATIQTRAGRGHNDRFSADGAVSSEVSADLAMSDKKTVALQVESKILLVRSQKVMLSIHLAEIYEVQPRVLVQAVKRNVERFPADFMFQLDDEEFANLKSQIVISSWGGMRRAPYAFTEQGVAMLSTVLRSPRAILVNIEIMRAFVRLRQMMVRSSRSRAPSR
jgi:hypothetical protein